jgi:hypothetical protein
MKLNELAVTRPTRQIAKVFEGHFDQRVQFDSLNRKQLHSMYRQVRSVLSEVRSSPARHHSEKNPAYLKMMMMEQALAEKIYEDEMGNTNPQPGTPGMNPQQTAAMTAQQQQEEIKQMEIDLKNKKDEVNDLQNAINQKKTSVTTMEWRQRARGHGYYLSEGEVQQAQVVLAAQDMVDKMQDMIEDSTEMQFKELPALVDSIKNQIGPDQAAQFNNDAQAALSGLVQNLQGSKQQLEQALGVVTGQAPTPGADMGAAGGMPGAAAGMPPAPGGDQGLAGPPPGGEEMPPAPEAEPGAAAPAAALGRGRR